MHFYKEKTNEYLTGVFTSVDVIDFLPNVIEIEEEEYTVLTSVAKNKPKDTLKYIYRVSAETNQYEPFIRTFNETVEWYTMQILSNQMTIDEVPEDYQNNVKEKLPSEPDQTNTYGISDEIYHNIIDDYTEELLGGEL